MTFAAEAYRAEGQFRLLKSTANKLKSLKSRLVTRKSTISKTVGQYYEPLQRSVKKGRLPNASEHLSV